MNTTKSGERKRAIIERIQNGETQVAIAKELGVTRQAISLIWKKYQRDGDSIFQTAGRGRVKENDVLSPNEKASFTEWLLSHTPRDIDEDADQWTLRLVKHAIARKLNKHVRIANAHEVYRRAYPEKVTFNPDADPPAAKPKRKPGRKPGKKKATSTAAPPAPAESQPAAPIRLSKTDFPEDSTDDGFPSVAEMERINKETLEKHGIDALTRARRPAAGVRLGKKAKGSKNPNQKPKRRKKKK
tara:strand:- start:9143 stop:9871 length:729 start_codon:yes stop_codon:yes gene_type:complete